MLNPFSSIRNFSFNNKLHTAYCLLHTVLLLPFLLFTPSCEEDFDMNATYQDIPVVFGLLDPGEDTIFLKINKAFLGEGNVLEMTKVEDSSIYKTKLQASIEEWENNALLRTYQLDTNTIGNKADGLFYNPYQLIYFVPYEPVTTREYRLNIKISDKTVSSSTHLVNNFSISQPSAGSKFITINPGMKSDIKWTSARYGKRYEIVIRIKYKEIRFDNPDTVYTYVDWSMGTKKSVTDLGGEDMSVSYSNDGFYDFIADQIPYEDAAQESNVRQRYTNDVDFIIAVAATEFNTYMEVNEPSNSIVQERPDYTNISNGLGLFSSRYKNVRTKKLNPQTIEDIQQLHPELKFAY